MNKLLLMTAATLLAGCAATPPAPKAVLEGEVYYLARMALPADATLSVSLQDVSRADAPAILLARQSGPITGQVPLPFQLQYDPSRIEAGHRYVIRARIEHERQLIFINTESHPVSFPPSGPLRVKVDPVR